MSKIGFIMKSGPYSSNRHEILYQLADAAVKKEHEVSIFLDLDGVLLAVNTQSSLEQLELPKDRIQDLVEKGINVYICKVCLDARGLNKPDMLIKGVKTGNMDNLTKMINDMDRLVTL